MHAKQSIPGFRLVFGIGLCVLVQAMQYIQVGPGCHRLGLTIYFTSYECDGIGPM